MSKLSSPNNDLGQSSWNNLYEYGSSRLANEGLIGIRYRIPKSFKYLFDRYRNCGPLEVLEIGAGVGEIAQMLVQSELDIRRYVGIEYSFQGTKRIHAQGFDCAQMNAEQLAFPDNSFDLVCCFDVMHHVAHPERMAAEIVRVTRKHLLLSEANGVSPVRKIGELTTQSRALGERSYFPWTYRSFFSRDQVAYIDLHPFYVLVPPKTPEPFIPYVVKISEFGERVAGLRWIGQSLIIAGEKRQRG